MLLSPMVNSQFSKTDHFLTQREFLNLFLLKASRTLHPPISPLSLASPQSPLLAPPYRPGPSMFCPRAQSLYLLSFYTLCLGVSFGLTGLKAIKGLMTHKRVTLCQMSPLTLESNSKSLT